VLNISATTREIGCYALSRLKNDNHSVATAISRNVESFQGFRPRKVALPVDRPTL